MVAGCRSPGIGRGHVANFIRAQGVDDRIRIYAAMHDVARHSLVAARHLRGDIYEVRAEGQNQAFRGQDRTDVTRTLAGPSAPIST